MKYKFTLAICIAVLINTQLAAQAGLWQTVASSNTPVARHECSYVDVGNKFYLIGGRGTKPVQVYDPITNTWATQTNPPMQMHHFQAVQSGGKIYVVGAFTGNCCHETPVANIYIYDPVTKVWTAGPLIPAARRRGGAGCVIQNNKIYMVCGIIDGHSSGWVSWLDVFDLQTNTWTQLADAPRPRDHFHATLVNGKIYAIGGRRTGFNGNLFSYTTPEVDIYDIASNTWTTLPSTKNIPTQRAACATAVIGDEILVIGGESAQVAHAQTEAFNVLNQSWRTLSPMNQSRHATSAVVYNNEVYIACGAGTRGGSMELNSQEKFSLTATPPDCVANEVVSFTLVKAGTAGDIGQMTNGMTINLATIGSFSIRANKCINGGSVKFILNGSTVRTESGAPYSINGDNGGSYIAWNPTVGTKTLTATPYTGSGASGTAGISETLTFTVVNQSGTPECVNAADCNDNNVCTQDQCVNETCTHTLITGCCISVADCNDNNPCTADACNNSTCSYTQSGGSGTPSYLKVVNPSASYRKMRLGYSSTGLFSPKYNVIAGGNNQLCITLKDVNGTAQWSKIKVKPQGASSPVVYLGTYVPPNPGTGLFTVCIPLSVFTSNDFTQLSYFELQCNNAPAFEIHIQKIEFTGGTSPFLWFGDPQINNFHDGTTGNTSELITTTVAGQPCGSAKLSNENTGPAPFTSLDAINMNAFPNPFSDELNITFTVPCDEKVDADIINVDGRIVSKIFSGMVKANELQTHALNAETLANGIYFFRLLTEAGEMQNRKLILIR